MFRTGVQRQSQADPAPFDVAVVGGGLAGMATALRLQATGLSTVVFEAHGHAGGCAGYWRHRGYSFDVGATTLVDFEPGGVGGELLSSVGIGPLRGESLPGYQAWLPDRQVTLHRDVAAWHQERTRAFGDSAAHQAFWRLVDRLAATFWAASRAGVRLPMRRPADLIHNASCVGLSGLPLARYMTSTVGMTLARYGLADDLALTAMLGMMVEDTVHTSVARAPMINAALGMTIRGAGLTRHEGGMHGFWRVLVSRYRELGGTLRTGHPVSAVTREADGYRVEHRRGTVGAERVVLAVPAVSAARICATTPLATRLRRYIDRDRDEMGGAVVVFLGVPQEEVAGAAMTHHQLVHDYRQPFGDGNNMFVSVSAPGDGISAPPGRRAVMISTHTSLSDWAGLADDVYSQRKKEMGERLVGLARRVYPTLGDRADVFAVGTPRTFARFTLRPSGAVGGPHQSLRNTNQHTIPHDLGGDGLWMVGDSTWPGVGTVACVLGSRIVADGIRREIRTS
jgi:C-3',4' desaturase CrtD